MRLILSITALIFTVISVTSGNSTTEKTALSLTPSAAATESTRGGIEQEIMKLEREWYEAGGVRHDVAAVARLEADEIIITVPNGQTVTKAQDLEGTKSSKDIYDANPIFEDMKVRVYGNTAVSTCHIKVTGSNDGKPFKHELRVTNVWVKKDRRWQVVAAHFSTFSEPSK